jgi:DNA polymerase III epsilon subunit family exonuclease
VENNSDSLTDKLINYLETNGGNCTSMEICSEVLGLGDIEKPMAKVLVEKGFPKDDRYRISDAGRVKLVRATVDDPLFDTTEYVVIDIEATSLPAPRNRITEFAAVMISDGEIVGEYSTLVNPGMRIPRYVQKITGIKDDMVKDAPRFEDVAEDIREVVGNKVIVAHNTTFDVTMLNFELDRTTGVRIENSSLCTVKLSRKLQPGLEKYKLGDVANFFDVEITDRHRAFSDAEATAKIFLKLLAIARGKGMDRLGQLMQFGGNGDREKHDKSV